LADLLNKAKELADKIASKGQYAVKQAVKAINICDEVSGSEGLNFEASLFSLCCGTDDFKEGTLAFLEKRKSAFKNK
jgi:enoyl-CoA hydratase